MRCGRRLVAVLVLLGACGGGQRSVEVAAGAGAPPELGSSLNVRVSGDSAHFELHITNTTTQPVRVTFRDAQRFDFEVTRGSGAPVWRWSEGRMFAQATGADELQPGASRSYEATWIAPGHRGEYVATARLTSDNYPVELRTVFRLPAE